MLAILVVETGLNVGQEVGLLHHRPQSQVLVDLIQLLVYLARKLDDFFNVFLLRYNSRLVVESSDLSLDFELLALNIVGVLVARG